MRTDTIRAVDYWIGNLLCGALTIHRRLADRRAGAMAGATEPRRILFIKLIEQGATVLAHEAIQRAVERVGRENVYFCVFAQNRPILDAMDMVPSSNVFEIRSDDLFTMANDLVRTIRRIRRAEIDTAIDLEFLSRGSAILSYLTGAVRRVGLHRFTEEAPYRGDLMTHRVLFNPFVHTARSYSLLVDALGADPADTPMVKIPLGPPPQPAPPFLPTAEETRSVWSLLEAIAGRPIDHPVVLLNPNSGDMLPLRRWPTERFVELGRRIVGADPAVTVVITGAPSEAAAADAVRREIDSTRVVCLAGRTTLRDMLVLYTLADVLVTNDSGPGHFASLTPIDNVVLFGPGAPSQFGPLGGRHHVLWAALACSPCVNAHNHRSSSCTDNVCMQAITVDAVYERVAAILARRRAERTQVDAAVRHPAGTGTA